MVTGHLLARGLPDAKDGRHRLFPTKPNISAVVIPHYRSFDAIDIAVPRICIGTWVLSFQLCEMSSLPPSTPALQRILSGDSQAIMTEVSQIDAAGSTVLDSLLYSDGAVPSSPIRIPSPVRAHSVEALLGHGFFNPTDVGATLAFMDQAGLEPLPEEDIEISDISAEESLEESSEEESSEEESSDKRSQRHLERLTNGRSNKILWKNKDYRLRVAIKKALSATSPLLTSDLAYEYEVAPQTLRRRLKGGRSHKEAGED